VERYSDHCSCRRVRFWLLKNIANSGDRGPRRSGVQSLQEMLPSFEASKIASSSFVVNIVLSSGVENIQEWNAMGCIGLLGDLSVGIQWVWMSRSVTELSLNPLPLRIATLPYCPIAPPLGSMQSDHARPYPTSRTTDSRLRSLAAATPVGSQNPMPQECLTPTQSRGQHVTHAQHASPTPAVDGPSPATWALRVPTLVPHYLFLSYCMLTLLLIAPQLLPACLLPFPFGLGGMHLVFMLHPVLFCLHGGQRCSTDNSALVR